MFFRSFLVGAVVWFIAAPAQAAIVGDASVPYNATRIVTIDGKSYKGSVFHVPGHQRHDVDLNGIPMSFILDFGTREGSVLLPALKSFIPFHLPRLITELDRGRLASKAVGHERVNGMAATKYRIDYTASDSTRGEGHVWLSDDNILLRIDGRVLRPGHKPIVIGMVLSNLTLGPQDNDLFLIPKGLRKIPAEALEALLNLNLKPQPKNR